MANLQNTVTGLLFTVFRWSICAYHVSSILEQHSRGLLEKYYHKPPNYRSLLLLSCLPSKRHFEALTAKLSLKTITTKKIADFQNSVTRL